MRRDYIEERAVEIGLFLVEHNATVRQAAKHFVISKSTVHKDVAQRLYHIDRALALQAQAVMQTNKEERHIRGGHATYLKYKGTKA